MTLLRQSLAGGNRRPMLQAPTGFGKTVLASAIVDGALSKNKRVIFTVPALSLIDQTVEMFWQEGIRDVGVIQGAHEMTSHHRAVQVASVQTLMKRHIPRSDVVMIDEAHRWFKFYGEWMRLPEWASVPFIGLSATPWTKGLGKFFDDLIIAETTAGLIEKGYLSKFRVFSPTHPDLTGVRTLAGDYHEGDLSVAMDKPPLVADVVETWRRLADDRPTFVFAVDCAHAKSIQERFKEAGISAEYIDAHTQLDERESIRRRFHDGSVRVVCNVGCLTTGVDWDVRCISLVRPTKSEMLFVQMIGRGLRTADGKDDCLILDHSDTHLRLGFVTDIHHQQLDDGQPKKKESKSQDREEPKPKECSKCSFLKPPRVHACPNCGFTPQRQSEVEHRDGKLAELTEQKLKADTATKQRWFSMLNHIRDERGYKQGWAAHTYKKKFGVWPHHSFNEHAKFPPNEEVLGFIKHLMIKHAHRREAA